MKKLAVLADIHGNSIALKAVLGDLKYRGGADLMIVLGDLAVFGPDPVGVLSLLEEIKPLISIRGNTDRYLVERQYPGAPEGQSRQAQLLTSLPWTARQLGQTGLHYLSSLPPQQLLHLSPEHTILAVHGSPRSDEESIRPDTSNTELASMLNSKEQQYNLLLCAHTHLPLDRRVSGRRVVNAGSVGLPFDGDPRAGYALIRLQPGGDYRVDFHRVAYDIEAVVNQLAILNHPTAHVSIYNLRTARPLSQDLAYTDKIRQG